MKVLKKKGGKKTSFGLRIILGRGNTVESSELRMNERGGEEAVEVGAGACVSLVQGEWGDLGKSPKGVG